MATALTAASLAPNATESAVANGDTRTITLTNEHTNESGSFTYMVNGVYDSGTLDKLNWFLRDWRLNEPTKMDPHLFDIVWEVYRESGSREPIDVLSGYRSPQTNAMLRRRSRQVAEYSQHMEGRAIDAHFIDVGTARIRDIAMRMQSGGVGFYPSGATPWVHIDSGSVRYWPRMSRDALARLFPDGKTVFIPADGQPMPGYEQARAEIESRGGQIQTASNGGFGIFAWLFGPRGGGADDAEESGGQEAFSTSHGRAGTAAQVQVADAGPAAVAKAKLNLPTGQTFATAAQTAPTTDPVEWRRSDSGVRSGRNQAAPQIVEAGPAAVAKAKLNLPTGQTFASAAPAEPAPPAKPQVVAAEDQNRAEDDASLLKTPLPPRRPIDFEAVGSLFKSPMPPARPADLVLASVQRTPSDAGVPALAPDPIAALMQRFQLPPAITQGVSGATPRALARAELPPAKKYDDETLLARAAELASPLPPMPIPNPQPRDNAGIQKSADVLSNEDAARLFGGLPFGAFETSKAEAAPDPSALRGAQQ